jgi:membrane fusion protein (multidrug efflux system)
MNKNFTRNAFAFTGLALFSSFGLMACEHQKDGGASAAQGGAKISAIVLNPSSVSTGLITSGTVLAEQQVAVQSQIMAQVTEIGFPEGGRVCQGQVLVKLDDSELKAQLEKASAALDLARAQEKRFSAQADAGAVSQQDYDSAKAQLESAQADVDLLKAQLVKCEIRAPFSGEVGLRQIELGMMLQPGSMVTTLQNLRSLRLEFSLPESQISGVRVGLPVRFTVSGRSDTLSAAIYAVEPGLDTLTGLLKVRARFAPPEKGSLRVGAFATVILPYEENSALWVPAQAVVESAQGSQVWLVQGGKAVLKVFTPGTRTAEAVEATQGLAAGDTVLLSGQMQLHPGTPVTPSVVKG